MRSRSLIGIVTIIAALVILFPALGSSQPRLLGIRHWSAPDETKVVLDLEGPVTYSFFELPDPPRFVLDISRISVKGIPPMIRVDDNIVKRLRIGRRSSGGLRLVADLKTPIQYEVFTLKRYLGKPRRLVIDLQSPELNKKVKEARKSFKRLNRRISRLVVIDPGHGGEDPGAIGYRRTREKDVVLALARRLQAMLDRQEGVRAVLTRHGDYFIPLRDRVRIAEEYGADLFISLHADANHSRRVRGASVYALSLKGATDEAARILADKENQSDLIGGVKMPYEDKGLSAILLDLQQTNMINESLRLGGLLLKALRPVSRIKFSMPKQAGFMVLRSYKFPAVLVETGFITNPWDERNLKSPLFQKRFASAVSSASYRFLRPLITQSRLIEGLDRGAQPLGSHVVEKGQTLSQIAKMYSTSTRRLMRLNRLKDASKIYAGQRLKVPR